MRTAGLCIHVCHAGRSSGGIAAERKERLVSFTIHDDGVGIPDGFHIDSSGTLGMQLVAGLAKQLGATVELLSGEGTTFVMAFPLDPDA